MINHKFRCTYVTDKEHAFLIIKHRVKPLNHFVSNNREIWVFDHQDTKVYNIAFKALNN